MAAAALDVSVKRVGVTWRGPYIVREAGTDAQNIMISLAGPLANVAALYVALRFYAPLGFPWPFCLLNLAMGFFNLLPLPCSDGLRILKLALRMSGKGKHEAIEAISQ
jgi:Zn-dependent protease